MIRQVKPTHVITHWKASLHPDHAAAHRIVNDAVLLASLEGFSSAHPRHRGVRGVYYADNWEDAEGFAPYVYVDVTEDLAAWKAAVTSLRVHPRRDLVLPVPRVLRGARPRARRGGRQALRGRPRGGPVREEARSRLAALRLTEESMIDTRNLSRPAALALVGCRPPARRRGGARRRRAPARHRLRRPPGRLRHRRRRHRRPLGGEGAPGQVRLGDERRRRPPVRGRRRAREAPARGGAGGGATVRHRRVRGARQPRRRARADARGAAADHPPHPPLERGRRDRPAAERLPPRPPLHRRPRAGHRLHGHGAERLPRHAAPAQEPGLPLRAGRLPAAQPVPARTWPSPSTR